MSQILKDVGKDIDKKVLIVNPLSYRRPRYVYEIA